MISKNYKEKSISLSKAIDIALDSYQNYPPKNFNVSHIATISDSLLESKKRALSPKPQFANLKSLKFIIDEVFTYFQDNFNDTTVYFWKQIAMQNLPFERRDKLASILKSKRIKNKSDYNYIIDIMGFCIQKQILTKEEIDLLNQLITDFEDKELSDS